MTKAAHRRVERVKPCGYRGWQACLRIVRERQMAKVNEVAVDLFSASALCAVVEKLNDANREKLLALPIGQAISISFKVIGLAE